MSAIAEDGTRKFLALKNITTGFPITLISTDGGVTYSTLFEPGAGDANNVVASGGKVILHGNFGTDDNIRDYNGGALDDISITGLSVGDVVNAVVFNSVDNVFYAAVTQSRELYKRESGVWTLVNAAVTLNGSRIIGLFGGPDALYIAGINAGVSKFVTSINGGVTILNKTSSLSGTGAVSVQGVVNVTT